MLVKHLTSLDWTRAVEFTSEQRHEHSSLSSGQRQ